MSDVVFQNTTEDKSFGKDLFEKVIKAGIIELGLDTKNIGVSINLVGEEKIIELNKKYRDKDKVTDVLSFPMQSEGLHRPEGAKRLEGPAPFDYAQGKSNAGAFDLGDIFICLPFAKKEAKSENIGIDRKLARLTVHGFLHLMGYDHEVSKKEETKMLSLENKILNHLGI